MLCQFNKNSDSYLILSGQFCRQGVTEVTQLRILDKPKSKPKLSLFIVFNLEIFNLPEAQFYHWSYRLLTAIYPNTSHSSTQDLVTAP